MGIRQESGTHTFHTEPLLKLDLATPLPPLQVTDSPKSLFLHTVVHSLDHWNFIRLFDTPGEVASMSSAADRELTETEFQLDYKAMFDYTWVALSLSHDYPKLFSVYYRQIGHPFYKRVYAEAKSLDPELAYHMQACICKI